MEEHDRASHGFHDSELWTITIVSNSDFSMIERLSKTPAFWNTLRTKAHKIPRFSGQVSGEKSLSAN
jgi:hypothetical protein